jgi:hypothetical protein
VTRWDELAERAGYGVSVTLDRLGRTAETVSNVCYSISGKAECWARRHRDKYIHAVRPTQADYVEGS